MIQVIPLDYAVTVAAGTGTQAVNTAKVSVTYSYKIGNIAIKAPTAQAAYAVNILDSDGYTIFSQTGITGDYSAACGRICRNNISVKITGTDGAYSARLYMEN